MLLINIFATTSTSPNSQQPEGKE